MTNWIQPHIKSMQTKSMRIFINLDDFFHTLFKPGTNNEFESCGNDASKRFLTNVFNLIAHYRWWAVKLRYNVEVYAYYSDSEAYHNGIYIPEYRKKASEYMSTNKYFYVKEAIKDSLDLIKVISDYIPKVYVINSLHIEPSIIPAYIDKTRGSADLNILVSRDIYDLQYAYKIGWIYISPKGDNSSFIHRDNMWGYINYKEKIFSDTYKDPHYPPKMIILARALVGDKYRSIPRLRSIGWKTLFKYLDSIQENIEENSYIVLEMRLKELLKGKLVEESKLQKNINCIDIDFQINTMTEIDKTIIDRQIVDIEDFENLKMLNKMKLSKYPLNLKFLCDNPIAPLDFKVNQWYIK